MQSLQLIKRVALSVQRNPRMFQKAMMSSDPSKKFNLPTIPADGLFRLPQVIFFDKPLATNVEDDFLERFAPEPVYDQNGDLLEPGTALKMFVAITATLVCGIVVFPSLLIPTEDTPRIMNNTFPTPTTNTSAINAAARRSFVEF